MSDTEHPEPRGTATQRTHAGSGARGSLEASAAEGTTSTSTITVDEVLAKCGLGLFHVRLVLACGLGFAAAGIEVVAAGFLIATLRQAWESNEFSLSMLPTLTGVGSLLGEFGFGFAADVYGRRWVFLVSVAVVVIFGLASACSTGMVSLVILRALVGVGYGGNCTVDFTLFAEVLPTRRRGEMIFLVSAFWPLGQLMTSLIAWMTIPNFGWRAFLAICAVPSFLTLFLRPLIPESPRWLLLHGRTREASEVCRHIAEVNGLSAEQVGLSGNVRLVVADEARPASSVPNGKGEKPSSRSSFSILFGKGLWFTTTGCVLFVGLLNVSGYATTTFMPSLLRMKGMENMDMYQAMVVSSLSQIPGILAAVYSAGIFGRIKPMYVSLLLQSCALIIFAFVRTPQYLLVCSCFASCFLEFGWALCHVYVPEVFPTQIRAFAQGFISGCGSAFSMLIPVITAWLLHETNAGSVVATNAIFLVGHDDGCSAQTHMTPALPFANDPTPALPETRHTRKHPDYF